MNSKKAKSFPSHWEDFDSIPSLDGYQEDRTLRGTAGLVPLSNDDIILTMNEAARIKRKIETQMKEGTQSSSFFNSLVISGKNEERIKSASEWDIDCMVGVQMFFNPISKMNLIVPDLPSENETLELGKEFFDNSTDENWIRKFQFENLEPKQTRLLFGKIFKVIFAEKSTEDKDEIYSDSLFRSLAEFVGLEDPKTKLTLREQPTLNSKLGNISFTSKIEFVVSLYDSFVGETPDAFAWIEDKRLKMPLPFLDTVAQKVGETISIGMEQRRGRDVDFYEVFGIGVRHRYFTFWHAVLPSHYLASLKNTPSQLKPNQFAVLNCYPQSHFGLDICVPKQRLEICRLFLAIVRYLQSFK